MVSLEQTRNAHHAKYRILSDEEIDRLLSSVPVFHRRKRKLTPIVS